MILIHSQKNQINIFKFSFILYNFQENQTFPFKFLIDIWLSTGFYSYQKFLNYQI